MYSVFEALYKPVPPGHNSDPKTPPKKRERWMVERDIASLEKKIEEHPRYLVTVPKLPDPKGDADLEALRAQHRKLQEELKTL